MMSQGERGGWGSARNQPGENGGAPNGAGPGKPGRAGRPPSSPIFNSPAIVTRMIGLMVVIFIVMGFLQGDMEYAITKFLSFVPATLTVEFPEGLLEALISTVTYQFLHGDIFHLLFNSVWMLIFGTIVARRLEVRSFVFFFLSCGIIGAFIHLIIYPTSSISVIGASGSILGLMGGAARFALFPPQGGWQLSMHPGAGPLTRLGDQRLLAFVGVMVVLNLFFGVSFSGDSSTAWDVHLGGLAAGLLLFPYFDRWRSGSGTGSQGRGDGKRSKSHLRQIK